jgi:hypothetical protein
MNANTLAMLAYEYREVLALAVGLFLVAATGLAVLIASLLIAGRVLPRT